MPKSPFNRGPFTGDNAPSDPLYRDQIHTTADETIPQPVIARLPGAAGQQPKGGRRGRLVVERALQASHR